MIPCYMYFLDHIYNTSDDPVNKNDTKVYNGYYDYQITRLQISLTVEYLNAFSLPPCNYQS